MNVYLESSAALRDLLDGEGAREIRAALAAADLVATSRLTLAEVGRVFARLRAIEPEIAARAADRESAFISESEIWALAPVDEEILARCARPFQVEPVRTMDALHLATIECVGAALSPFVVLSTDRRVRDNAEAMRWRVAP